MHQLIYIRKVSDQGKPRLDVIDPCDQQRQLARKQVSETLIRKQEKRDRRKKGGQINGRNGSEDHLGRQERSTRYTDARHTSGSAAQY